MNETNNWEKENSDIDTIRSSRLKMYHSVGFSETTVHMRLCSSVKGCSIIFSHKQQSPSPKLLTEIVFI